jgi:hypothetical protein
MTVRSARQRQHPCAAQHDEPDTRAGNRGDVHALAAHAPQQQPHRHSSSSTSCRPERTRDSRRGGEPVRSPLLTSRAERRSSHGDTDRRAHRRRETHTPASPRRRKRSGAATGPGTAALSAPTPTHPDTRLARVLKRTAPPPRSTHQQKRHTAEHAAPHPLEAAAAKERGAQLGVNRGHLEL